MTAAPSDITPSASKGNDVPLFVCEGRPVFRGDQLYVIESRYLQAAGDLVTAEFESHHDYVRVRTRNGAVPVVQIKALSWNPNPDFEDRRRIMAQTGIHSPSDVSHRDLQMYRLGLSDAARSTE